MNDATQPLPNGNENSLKKYRVLIADDYEADRFFLKRAIAAHAPRLEVIAEVDDGDEVIAYLWGYGKYSNREKYPLPDLLIMDVRMPRMTGMNVLEWLKTQKFSSLKVAMLADTSAVMFRDQALKFGLTHFFPKNANPTAIVDELKILQAELDQENQQHFILAGNPAAKVSAPIASGVPLCLEIVPHAHQAAGQ